MKIFSYFQTVLDNNIDLYFNILRHIYMAILNVFMESLKIQIQKIISWFFHMGITVKNVVKSISI
jgi:hypothetical protein